MIAALRVRPYHVRFAAAARDARTSHAEREGVVVTLETTAGVLGFGEAAPLPGRSSESLSECADALRGLALAVLPSAAELFGDDWLGAIERASTRLPRHLAAARHALEAALLDVAAKLRNVPAPLALAQALGKSVSSAALPVAALVDERDIGAALARAELALRGGAGALKLKIAGEESDENIVGRVRALRQACGAHVGLRLDANQSLSVAQVRRLSEALGPGAVEYVEEPVAPRLLPALGAIAWPIALDETLLEPELELGRARELGAAVIVLKPMLFGLSESLAWVERARAHGLSLVLSHTFDGPVAMALARSLALALGSDEPRLAHGLAAHAALDAWPAPCPPHLCSSPLALWKSSGFGFGPELEP